MQIKSLANEFGAGYMWGLYMGYFLRKYLTWVGCGQKKNENFCSIGSCGRDRGGWMATGAAGTAAAGRGGAGGGDGAE